jgi:hypothetical protein
MTIHDLCCRLRISLVLNGKDFVCVEVDCRPGAGSYRVRIVE